MAKKPKTKHQEKKPAPAEASKLGDLMKAADDAGGDEFVEDVGGEDDGDEFADEGDQDTSNDVMFKKGDPVVVTEAVPNYDGVVIDSVVNGDGVREYCVESAKYPRTWWIVGHLRPRV